VLSTILFILSLFLLDLVKIFFQPVKLLVPVPLKVGDPIVDGLELFGVYPVHALATDTPFADQVNLFQHTQMLGNHRLRPFEHGYNIIHGQLFADERFEQPPPLWFCYSVEGI